MNFNSGDGGTAEKRRQVNEHVWDEFPSSRERITQVHDRDLVRWGAEKAHELGLEGFKGSKQWIQEWEKKHDIVKRKINKRFTRRQFRQQPQVKLSIDEFLDKIRRLINNNPNPTLKFNFTLEIRGTRYVHDMIIRKMQSLTRTLHCLLLIVKETCIPHISLFCKSKADFLVRKSNKQCFVIQTF